MNTSAQVPTDSVTQLAPLTKKYKILIVEDEEDSAEIFRTLLGENPEYIVNVANNGRAGLKELESKNYDLVLLDIIMPDIDGFQVLKQIRDLPAKYGTPKVLMLTNVNGDLALEKAQELKSDGYLLKIDIEPEQLIKKVKATLEGKDYQTTDSAQVTGQSEREVVNG